MICTIFTCIAFEGAYGSRWAWLDNSLHGARVICLRQGDNMNKNIFYIIGVVVVIVVVLKLLGLF